ncbi:MAG TPA: hypothetical protein VMV18_08600 [bacterium]|nr:hypothetical protein [bacterium]
MVTPLPATVQVLDGDVLYREWVPGPAARVWWIGATLALVVAAVGVFFAARGGWMSVVWILVSLFALALAATVYTFRGLSIVVDSRGIAWNFGVLRRRYSLDEVSMFRERVFHFPRESGVGGWGIGRAHDGVDLYEVWGANGSALDLIVNEKGASRHFLVSTAAPDRLVVQIVRALERRKAAASAR